jgi:dienelactone hydrolase
MKRLAYFVLVATSIAAAVAPSAGTAAAAPVAAPSTVPVEAFFSFADMSQPLLSPDGSAVAMLVRNKQGRRQLAIIDTADLTKSRIVASYADWDVSHANWVNSKRLVFSLSDEAESAFEQRGSGLFGIDRDGENLRDLIFMRGHATTVGTVIKARTLIPSDYQFVQTIDDGSDDVIIERVMHTDPTGRGQYIREFIGAIPLRLDTRTGNVRDAVAGRLPDHVHQWVFDDQGHARAAIAQDGDTTTILSPEAASSSWKERTHFPRYGLSPGNFDIEDVGGDGRIYVTRQSDDAAGSRALYRLDADTFMPETQPVVRVKGFDIDAGLVEDTRQHKLLGVHYDADADGTTWFDPALTALQAKVDAKLPGLVNRIDPARCGCAQRVLVTSFSDRQPALFYLYDRSDDTLMQIGSARPAIARRQMADTDFVRIKARDGHDIPMYVTKPHGKGPWPTVILVHGGPFLRGWHWRWDDESQFLASRGYLVVKPEFRGSAGYGQTLFESGFKQWGLTMQDDIADATRWAAQQGLEDPQRTCIAGGSYGGYAALMGLVRYPELYRCGVAYSAVTDINLMYSNEWSDASSDYRAYGVPALIGDPVKDAAQLEATSPLQQVARITRPLLLAHGGVDRRVPVEQAAKLRSALQAGKTPLTWIEYKDEAHGWSKPANRFDFYTKEQAFLDAQIGPGSTPAAGGAAGAAQ